MLDAATNVELLKIALHIADNKEDRSALLSRLGLQGSVDKLTLMLVIAQELRRELSTAQTP